MEYCKEQAFPSSRLSWHLSTRQTPENAKWWKAELAGCGAWDPPFLSSSWLLQWLELLWLFRGSCDPLVFRCVGHGAALGRGLCWWVSLGELSEMKPCGRRNTNLWQAEIPGLWGHLCAVQNAGSFLAPREAAVALVAFPGVQRNPYHPPQMEGSKGLERGTCPTSLLQDWLAFPNPSFWSLLTILSAAVTSSPLDLWTAAWGESCHCRHPSCCLNPGAGGTDLFCFSS